MAALREVLAVFGVEFDGRELDQGNRKIDDTVGKLRELGTALAGAFALDKVKDFAMQMVSTADAIGDQAARLGIGTKALQEFGFMAQFADLQGEALDGIFTRLAVSANKADEGSKGLSKTLKDLGVNVKNQDGSMKNAAQLFEETGLALAGVSDSTERTAKAVQLFGRGNANKVLQIFKDGAPGIAKYREEFEVLGGAFDDAFLERAGEIDDQMHRLNVAWTTAKVRIAGVLLPVVKSISTFLTQASVAFSKVTKDSNLTQSAFVLMGAAGVVQASRLIQAFGGFAAIGKIFLRWLLPLGLALVALDELITFVKGGDTVLGEMLDKAFGAGTQEKVRGFFKAVQTEVAGFFSDLSERPEKFEKDWRDLVTFMGEDIQRLPPVVGPVVQGILDMFLVAVDLMTGGWNNLVEKVGAGASLAGLVITGAFDKAKLSVLTQFAEIGNAWANLWNSAVKVASDTVKKIGDALGGDTNAIGRFFKESGAKLAGITVGDGGANLAALKVTAAQQDVAFKSAVAARGDVAFGAARPGLTVNAPVTVNVPPGTPAQTAQRVGNVAASGVNRAAGMATRQRGSKQ